jgi:Lipid-droplet associated hydrolase
MSEGNGAVVTAGFVSSPRAILAVLALGRAEMINITELDTHLLETHASRFTFYWGAAEDDGWVRESSVEEIMAVVAAGGARALRCDQGIPHDFCLARDKDMAKKCVGWLKEDFGDE